MKKINFKNVFYYSLVFVLLFITVWFAIKAHQSTQELRNVLNLAKGITPNN